MKHAVRTTLLLAAAALLVTAHAARAQGSRPPRLPRSQPILKDTATAKPVRICAGGDVTLGTNLTPDWTYSASEKYGVRLKPYPDPDSLLAPLRPLFQDADIVLLNVEGAIGEGPAPRKCPPNSTKCFAFRQPTGTAAALRRLSDSAQVVGNVANNHAGDAGRPGLRATVRNLADADVRVTGVDTLPTVVVTPRGDTVAFLGFSVWSGPDVRDLNAVRRHVGRAAERYGRVVVTMHMGAEGRTAQNTRDASETFYGEDRGNPVAFARAAAQAGADLVIGHGPHVVRALEWRGRTLVMYSLGNLLTYGPFSLVEPLNRGAVACASLDRSGLVTDAELRPTRQRYPGAVLPDLSGRALELADSLGQEDFPASGARVGPDGKVAIPAEVAMRGRRRVPAPRPGGAGGGGPRPSGPRP